MLSTGNHAAYGFAIERIRKCRKSEALFRKSEASMKLPPMNTLRAFEAVSRLGSISKAADELCVSQGAVSQQIRNLENYLARELFDRHGNALELSEAGRYLTPIVHDALLAIAEAVGEVSRVMDDSRLVVSTWQGFAAKWLMPRLQRFYAAYPDVTVVLDLSTGVVNFNNDGIDAAIRFGASDSAELDSVLLFQPKIRAVASPAYLQDHAPIRSLSNPAEQTLIDHFYPSREVRNQHLHWQDLIDGELTESGNRHLSFPDEQQALNAAILGQGVALSSTYAIEQELASDKIRLAAPDVVAARSSIYFVRPKQARPNPAIDAFCNWLVDELKGYR
jgi:LysR family glycine cleavage system transcriptional activator